MSDIKTSLLNVATSVEDKFTNMAFQIHYAAMVGAVAGLLEAVERVAGNLDTDEQESTKKSNYSDNLAQPTIPHFIANKKRKF
uniref:SFRICE_000725 n=1 Tax=Spodoptera frugiperda TaxID=7108 RepID=A0A2H1W520_SPOFR